MKKLGEDEQLFLASMMFMALVSIIGILLMLILA